MTADTTAKNSILNDLWSLLYGINGIVTGIHLRKKKKGEWSMIIGGVLSIIFGIIIMIYPLVSAIAIVNSMGIIAVIGGIIVIVIAFTLRKKQII